MSIIGRQFGRPRGLLGRLVGRLMARGNADFNQWVIQYVREQCGEDVRRLVELGPGPGIGLQAALRAFPGAQVWGVDPSPEMRSQSRKRNLEHVTSGRLALLEGDVESLQALAPVDLVIAVHVLYFWHRPAIELTRLHGVLRPGGFLALGYQLRPNMPGVSQTGFPKEGHLLYDNADEVSALMYAAGFTNVRCAVKGPRQAPEGQLALATA